MFFYGSESDGFVLNWDRICNCIAHEMWPKLASSIRGIVSEEKNEISADPFCDEKSMDKIIEILKVKRNLVVEERKYIKALVERARKWNETQTKAVTNQCLVYPIFISQKRSNYAKT